MDRWFEWTSIWRGIASASVGMPPVLQQVDSTGDLYIVTEAQDAENARQNAQQMVDTLLPEYQWRFVRWHAIKESDERLTEIEARLMTIADRIPGQWGGD